MSLLSLFSGSHNYNYRQSGDGTVKELRICGEDVVIGVETLKTKDKKSITYLKGMVPIPPIILNLLPTLIEIGTKEVKRAIKRDYAAYVATYGASQTLFDAIAYQPCQRYTLTRNVLVKKGNDVSSVTACEIRLLRRSWADRHVYQVESVYLPVSKARAGNNDRCIQLSVGISELFWDASGNVFKSVSVERIVLPPVPVGSERQDLSHRNLFSLPFPNAGADQLQIAVAETNAAKQPYEAIAEETNASLDDLKTIVDKLHAELAAERKDWEDKKKQDEAEARLKGANGSAATNPIQGPALSSSGSGLGKRI